MQTAAPLSIQSSDTIFPDLKTKINSSNLPDNLALKLTSQLDRLEKNIASSGYRVEVDRELEYIEFVSNLPFDKSSQDILDLPRASEILNKNHYGLKDAKERILEYLSVLILNHKQNQTFHSQTLAFVGLVGSGKTSLAYSIAECLGRKIIRIPFGGLGSVKELRGQSRIQMDAEPGLLMKYINNCGVNNPVVLLDELDRVSQEHHSDVMGTLVELLDPEQNWAFVDHFVDHPFDLSKVLFIATANNTNNIATAVLDRLELIEMPSYSDSEKIAIGRDYILPKVLTDSGLAEGMVVVDPTLWPQIVRPLGYDAGIRSLQRTIQQIVRKVAKQVVEGAVGPFNLTSATIEQYL